MAFLRKRSIELDESSGDMQRSDSEIARLDPFATTGFRQQYSSAPLITSGHNRIRMVLQYNVDFVPKPLPY